MKRKVLGKGIEAIIANQASDGSEGERILDLPLDSIQPNPFQPRKVFSEEKISELAESIRETGMIQPVVVYREDDHYFLLVGERRWRAAQKLKWQQIPALVKQLSHDEIMIGTLVENIQREDLNAIETAEGISRLMVKLGLTQEQAADKLGMSRSAVANFLRLLKLPDAVKRSLAGGVISQGHARPLLSLRSPEDMLALARHIEKKGLSVRQTENLVKNYYREKDTTRFVDPDVKKTEEKMSRLLSTKVKLHYGRKGKGKIEIFFTSLDDFDRIFSLLGRE